MPKGWKRVKSESRPGEFSYLNTKTGKKYDKLPQSALNQIEGDFFDDAKGLEESQVGVAAGRVLLSEHENWEKVR